MSKDKHKINSLLYFLFEGFDMSWCKQPDIGLPRPDTIVYLTLSSEAAARRGNYGEERYEQTDFQKKVADNFAALTEDSWKVGGNV